MANALRTETFFQELEADHRNWLSAFDSRFLRNWKNLLKNDREGEEAALAEARVRQLLQGCGVTVEPNEDVHGSGPDFRCNPRGGMFYVEATCVRIETAVNAGYPTSPQDELYWSNTKEPISKKCKNKQRQCFNLLRTVLVAIGTFHPWMAMDFFDKCLANQVLMHMQNWARHPTAWTGCQVTAPDSTAERDSNRRGFCLDAIDEIGSRYDHISGLLLCGLTLEHRTLIGLLHPESVRPFDPAILPQVEFGQATEDRASGQLRVDWLGGNDERPVRRIACLDSVSASTLPSPRPSPAR